MGFVSWHTPQTLRIFHACFEFESYFCLLCPLPPLFSLCITSSLSWSQRRLGFWEYLPGRTAAIGLGSIFCLKMFPSFLRGRNYLPAYHIINFFLLFYSCLPEHAKGKKKQALSLQLNFPRGLFNIQINGVDRHMLSNNASILLFWQRTKMHIVLSLSLMSIYGDSLVWMNK